MTSENYSTDTIYKAPLQTVGDFIFDEKIVNVFPDMIKRSVPGYETIIAMIGILAEKYVQENSDCYDLGCSLGEATFSMLQHISNRSCNIVAVDNSEAMIRNCRKMLQERPLENARVKLVQDDIQNISIENASVVVLNFTLQFIPLAERLAIIRKIYDGMRPNGVLILSEKITFDDASLDDAFVDMHHHFKRTNGYSDLEISQKRTALENVLIPETLPQHRERILKAGFSHCDAWFQCFNFVSILAIK